MSKARIMSAGTVGTNRRIRVNGPEGGGNALQGLPPICNMRSALVPYVRTRADGENRNVVFCVNQLGGIGAKRGPFGPGNRAGVGQTGGCRSSKLNWTGPFIPRTFSELLQVADKDGDGKVSNAELQEYFEGHVNADDVDLNNNDEISHHEYQTLRAKLASKYNLTASDPTRPDTKMCKCNCVLPTTQACAAIPKSWDPVAGWWTEGQVFEGPVVIDTYAGWFPALEDAGDTTEPVVIHVLRLDENRSVLTEGYRRIDDMYAAFDEKGWPVGYAPWPGLPGDASGMGNIKSRQVELPITIKQPNGNPAFRPQPGGVIVRVDRPDLIKHDSQWIHYIDPKVVVGDWAFYLPTGNYISDNQGFIDGWSSQDVYGGRNDPEVPAELLQKQGPNKNQFRGIRNLCSPIRIKGSDVAENNAYTDLYYNGSYAKNNFVVERVNYAPLTAQCFGTYANNSNPPNAQCGQRKGHARCDVFGAIQSIDDYGC